ncbi:MAG TPA: Ig-like domain-containing protein [Terriglobales bacterium]|nr:Ig-like domain-containing protein [Terriglobales bacterium]
MSIAFCPALSAWDCGRFNRCLRLGFLLSLLSVPAWAQLSVLTHRADAARDGQNLNEVLLTPSNVNTRQFGSLYSYPVDGYVSAQPLYMQNVNTVGGPHNVLFVATEHDSVYALDADNPNSAPLWQTSFINPDSGVTTVPMTEQGCTNVTLLNEVGILSTPVIDPVSQTLYVVAKTKEVIGGNTNYVFRLHALDITSGLDKLTPTVITATVNGSRGPVNLDTFHDFQRPALLLSNGTLYITFGSNGCDTNAHGWVLAYSASSLQQIAAWNSTPNQVYGGSIWMSGEGLAGDSNGYVYFSTANGTFNASTGGSDYGDTVLKLNLTGSSLTVADYFTPFDQANMRQNDLDLASGGVTLLPDQPGNYPHLAVAIGKTGTIYLLNRDNMGKYNPSGNSQIVQSLANATLEHYGAPTYWNHYLYFSARNDYIKQFTMTNGLLSTAPTAQSPTAYLVFGIPVVSANGNTNGILWTVRNVSSKGAMVLSAYNATTMAELYNTNQNSGRDALGTAPHFVSPVVANGRVYVGTQGVVKVYGLLSSVSVTGGNRQTGTVGTKLPVSLSIQAVSPYSGPVAGVSVTFSDGGAGGTFGTPTATTDANGNASTTYTLPGTAGTVNITATSSNYVSASFSETAVASTPASIVVLSGSYQSATVGTQLAAPLVVKVKDASGNGVPGVSVTFSDNGANGSFSGNPIVTDSGGKATVNYTVPTKARSITIAASTGTLSVNFQEKATAGPATTLNLVSGNNQSAAAGTQLPGALAVSVKDQYGNPVGGVTVTFSDNGAGGSFSTTTPITTSGGQASVTYTLPSTPGAVGITATINGLTVTFTETAK